MTAQTAKTLLSFEEYLDRIDETENRYELVSGKLELMNPPTVRHFLIAKLLEQEFDRQIENRNLDWLCFREAGVRTGWQKSRLPDLFIIERNVAMELIDSSAVFQTTPFLIVEIASPESKTRDYRYKRCSAVLGVSPMSDCIKKRSEYAALEVPEYWIIDPQENKITVLNLNEGLYEDAVFTEEEKIVSFVFPELELTAKKVLRVRK